MATELTWLGHGSWVNLPWGHVKLTPALHS